MRVFECRVRCIGAMTSWVEGRMLSTCEGVCGVLVGVCVGVIPNFTGLAENCIFLQFKHQIFGYGPFLHLLPTDPCP